MYNSTYKAEYIPGDQTVMLTDMITESDYHILEFVTFKRLSVMVFGEERARRIVATLCGYKTLVISWEEKKVATPPPTADLTNEFFKRAFSIENLETMQDRAGEPGFDWNEYDESLLGIMPQ